MKKFEELGLSRELSDILKSEGIENPTEIQEKAIPLALKGKDIVGASATGSGKTLAFSSPIIEHLKHEKNVQALVLTPTRELAEQVSGLIHKFSNRKGINVVSVYGGVSIENQIRKLGSADVVVGTPGRILDHMQRGSLRLNKIKILVLDEVDRMFDMGFHKDVEKIIKECPKERQTMLFSATISSEMDYLARKYTRDATSVSVKVYHDSTKLKQVYYDIDARDKFSLLVHLLKKENADLVMVFCSTRRNVDFVANNLKLSGINAKAIHGGMEQSKRIRTLNEFHGKGVGVLVCTDVAARGLDIKGVSHIYNYDLPKTSVEYIHRIGRTARAKSDGIVINLLCGRDYENFSNILSDRKIQIKNEEAPKFRRVYVRLPERRPRQGNFRGVGKNFGRRNTSRPPRHGNRKRMGRNFNRR